VNSGACALFQTGIRQDKVPQKSSLEEGASPAFLGADDDTSQLDEPPAERESSERLHYDDLFPKPVRRERELVMA
jgi:hypothetical protein